MTKLPIIVLLGAALASCSNTPTEQVRKGNATEKGEVILHAWSWNLDTIANNMKLIAESGYDYVQTSPVQTCFVGDDGGMALFSEPGDSVKGKWYYYYQPTDWKIGNYMLGDREAFKNMCDSARKYGVRVLVDVLPNHTAVDHTAVLPDLDAAVGGHENLFHANGFTPITQWNDRFECTTGEMGGLPDVNTENPDFQHYYLQYVNDLISLGARGFRYDTAKHIGLPSDPLDEKAERNNFWDVVTGREAVKGLSLLYPDSLYIYGEVLQDKNVKETEYAEYVDVTASNYGHALRHALEAGVDSVEGGLEDWRNPAGGERIVTWVESHDTYCNAHESAGLTDDQIRAAWVFLDTRAGGRPLFFSRPEGSTRENYWGTNRIGNRGNDEFFHPAVVAANKFRHAMAGEPEKITTTAGSNVVLTERGVKGASIVNLGNNEEKIAIPTTLPDGKYADVLGAAEFTVENGTLTGTAVPLGTYIIYVQ